jgi:hypothetical protein
MRLDDGGPVEQKTGTSSNMLALHKGDGWLHAAADITPVYGGKVGKVQREIVYLEPDAIVVYDRVTSSASQSQVWSLAFPTDPTMNGAQTTVVNADHMLTVQRMSPAGATTSIHPYSQDSDFTGGFRLDEQMAGGDQRWLHVIWIDNAASNVASVDGNTVSLTVGGKTVRVGFDPNAIGGTLQIGSTTTTLGAGIDELPE